MKKKAPAAKKAAPGKPARRVTPPSAAPDAAGLFDRVAAILDQARAGVARAVNSGMVLAYWLIGREIVEELQGGDERAAYGKRIVRDLSDRLTARYGEGFGPLNLWLFRRFYLVFSNRAAVIPGPAETQPLASTKVYPAGKLSAAARNSTSALSSIVYPAGKELSSSESHPPPGELAGPQKRSPMGGESPCPFHPNLSWSHYRALLSVDKPEAREFYESECAAAGWTKRELERQVHSLYYERLLASTDKKGMVREQRGQRPATDPAEVLTSSTVLEFLGIPRSPRLQESTLEQAIMDNLQTFLLELGRGFSFVARQKLLRYEADEFYVDLVFYNYLLKCFVLIDLKIGKLTHQDVGQMDSYVRLYEDLHKVPGDNPTIGLILCSEKNETIARYSVLHENQQLFASKYRLHLPSEEELAAELKREIKCIEEGQV